MKNHLSLRHLISGLINSAPKPQYESITEEDKKVGTTLRLDPELRLFIESHAENMGISLQEFINITLRSIMRATEQTPEISQLDLMHDRFFELFSSHELATIEIPQLLSDYNIVPSTLLSKGNLIDELPLLIDHLASLFNINIEWLKGIDTPAFKTKRFYKNMNAFGNYILRSRLKHETVEVYFVTTDNFDFTKCNFEDYEPDMGIIVKSKKHVEGLSFNEWCVFKDEPWGYERSRKQLKMLMLLCEKTHISSIGYKVDKEIFDSLFRERLNPVPRIFPRHSSVWHPDQYFWDDDRNPHLSEMKMLKESYNDYKLNEYEVAIKSPHLVINADEVINKKERFKLKE